MEIFDNFKEFNKIKKKVLKLTGHNFKCPVFEKNQNYSGCSGSLYDFNTADYFLYIYSDFGWQFLRERAEEENNENYKRQLLNLIDYCVYRENEIKEDFLDFLSEFDLDQYYNNLCKYIPIRTTTITKFIDDNGEIYESKIFNKILVTLIIYLTTDKYIEHEEDYLYLKQIIDRAITHIIGNNMIADKSLFLKDFLQIFVNVNKKKALKLDKLLNDMNLSIKEYNGKIQENGTIIIPWKHVFFMNCYILIFHPNHPIGESNSSYRYEISESKKIYNQVSSVFIKKLPGIIAECKNGKVIKVLNISNISDCIEILRKKTSPPQVKTTEPDDSKKITSKEYLSNNEIIQKIKQLKSEYLDYLSNIHIDKYKIFHSPEVRVNSNDVVVDEEAFIFTINEGSESIVVLYENIIPSRASIVFTLKKEKYQDAINSINNYFTSLVTNKREKLIRRTIAFNHEGIIGYDRVVHDCFHNWKLNIIQVLHTTKNNNI